MAALFLLTLLSSASAELVADYTFENGLRSSVEGAAELQYLGSDPVFTDELFASGNQRVLRFLAGEGLELTQFSELAGESYTLIAVFRFDETISWRRIFDFKNATSDWGLYGYYGRLNFYNIETGPDVLVKRAEYIEVALTRDAEGMVRGYVDGSLQIEFDDSQRREALTNDDDKLVLFRDDQIVRNEHTSGRINRLRIYNRALTATEIGEGVAELDVRFGGGSQEFQGEWRISSWFGNYNERHYPWIQSPVFGWSRVTLMQNGTFWFFLPSYGFVWSDESLFPYCFDPVERNWLVFESGASGVQLAPLAD
jgi:hypothetical protein